MVRKLLDRKGFLSGKLRIYANGGQEVGYIKLRPLASSGVGKFYGNELIFENKGFFSFQTVIKDANNKETLGRANSGFTLFKKRKIEFTIDDQVYFWKPGGFYGDNWIITDFNGEILIDTKLNRSDKTDTDSMHNLMLAGLYFRANLWRNIEFFSTFAILLLVILIIDFNAVIDSATRTYHELNRH